MDFEVWQNPANKIQFFGLAGTDDEITCAKSAVFRNKVILAYLSGHSILAFTYKKGKLFLKRVTDDGGLVYKRGATDLIAELLCVGRS